MIDQLSDALAARVAAVAHCVVAIRTGHRHVTGLLWRPDVVVTSEQTLPDQASFGVVQGGAAQEATLAGRDPTTNVAVLRLAQPLPSTLPPPATVPAVGSLALVAGADAQGNPTARLAMVLATGPAWHSMRGGRIDALIRLDGRIGSDEGGPVLGNGGALIGMSTTGPRCMTLVIPTATIARVVEPLLTEGRIARGWFGVVMQPVSIPDAMRAAAGHDSGMMVTNLASGGPAEQAGVLPGDIVLDIDGHATRPNRQLAALLGPDRIGQTVAVRLLRAGAVQTVAVLVAARPAE